MIFYLLVSFVITQRLIELIIAKRNEKWMRDQGGIEVANEHYKWIVIVHVLFFISLLIETTINKLELSPIWPFFLLLFIFAQVVRVWSLYTLGKYWNTKIIVLPNTEVVAKGPYRFIRHPNYFVVALEILVIPLMFNAYITAVVFSLLNAIVLSIRIPREEKALEEATNYHEVFRKRSRFTPTKLS